MSARRSAQWLAVFVAILAGLLVVNHLVGDDKDNTASANSFDASSIDCKDLPKAQAKVRKDSDTGKISVAETTKRFAALEKRKQSKDCAVAKSDCSKQFVIKHDDNTNHRVLSEGLQGQSREAINQFIDYAGHDERALSYIGDHTPGVGHTAPTDLRDGKCLSEDGQQMWYRIKGAWDSAKVEESAAPADGYNTGMTPNGAVQASHAGVTGNRHAVKVVFQNGDTLWVMYRCGNIVTKKPLPERPTGPTDNQPPPTTSTTVPTTTTLKPKDPSQDPMRNPAVPDKPKGPGTTPVGSDPGTATPVCDSPTGYCTTTQSTTTTTTQPSGSSSSTTSTTEPTPHQDSGAGATTNTTSPPTTTAPSEDRDGYNDGTVPSE
jgi:hypothetical protein